MTWTWKIGIFCQVTDVASFSKSNLKYLLLKFITYLIIKQEHLNDGYKNLSMRFEQFGSL